MSVTDIISKTKEEFVKCSEHLLGEFAKLRIGRASSALVEDLRVVVYGGEQPLKNLASISIPEARTISIVPWDKSIMQAVEKAIRDSEIGLNPNNNGQSIMLNVPPLTEERRKELVKVVHKMAEDARITVRSKRQDAMSKFKNMEKDDQISEDERTGAEKKLQEVVDMYNKQIDEAAKKKEEEVLKV